MKVLLVNGSPHANGNTRQALEVVGKVLENEGIETIYVNIGTNAIQGCIGCYSCFENKVCAFNNGVYSEIREILEQGVDGFVFGSPTYYAGPNGSLCSLMDRLFYSLGRYFYGKPAAAVGVARRGGAVQTVDRINKYFAINSMPIVTSQYWNLAYGRSAGEMLQDEEGVQTMEIIGREMARMLNALKDKPLPEPIPRKATSFIR